MEHQQQYSCGVDRQLIDPVAVSTSSPTYGCRPTTSPPPASSRLQLCAGISAPCNGSFRRPRHVGHPHQQDCILVDAAPVTMGGGGTLLRTFNGRPEHVYESASFGRPLLATSTPYCRGGAAGFSHGGLPPPSSSSNGTPGVVYYEVDAQAVQNELNNGGIGGNTTEFGQVACMAGR